MASPASASPRGSRWSSRRTASSRGDVTGVGLAAQIAQNLGMLQRISAVEMQGGPQCTARRASRAGRSPHMPARTAGRSGCCRPTSARGLASGGGRFMLPGCLLRSGAGGGGRTADQAAAFLRAAPGSAICLAALRRLPRGRVQGAWAPTTAWRRPALHASWPTARRGGRMSAHDGLAARRPPLPPPPHPTSVFLAQQPPVREHGVGRGGRGAALQLLCYLAEAEAARHSTR